MGMCPFGAQLGWKPRSPIDLIAIAKPKIAAVQDFQAILKEQFNDANYDYTVAKAKQAAKAASHAKFPCYPCYKVDDWV